MPPFDYSDPPPSKFEPKIPEGTKTTVVIHVKQGGVGEDQMLTRSKDGGCEMLAVVFTVADGAYKGEKFPENWVLEGTTDGHAKAGEITRRKLKAILDSAFGLDPNDKSPEARARRGNSRAWPSWLRSASRRAAGTTAIRISWRG